MPSIGNIVVKRIIERKLLPPVSKPIVKGPTFPLVIAPEIVSPPQGIILPGGKGALPGGIKSVIKGITQSVIVGAGSVTRTKVSGVVGISYTQLSYTSLSYTLIGAQITKSLSQSITITEPLTVQRSKKRILSDSDGTEMSESTTIQRVKTRALTETSTIQPGSVLAEKIRGARRELVETENISDTVIAVKESKRTLVQNDALDDNVAIILPGIRMSLIENVPIVEDLDFEKTHAGAVNITKSLSDSTTISDSHVRRVTNVRSVAAETISITESVVKELAAHVSFTSSYTDLSYTSATRAEKSLTENVDESHTLRMALTKNRSITETVIVSEDLTLTIILPTGDIVLITDEVIRIVGKARGLSQSVSIIG